MKLLKRNILNGKAEEVDSYDAFDEVTINNFGSLQKDWNINNFDEFVDAFKKDKEMEITCGDWTFENIPVKLTDEEFILEHQGKEIGKYLDHLVNTAEDVVMQLKDYRRKVDDIDYIKNSGKEKVVQWAMNLVQQISWHFDEGADVVTKYAVAKIAKEFSEKQV